MLRIIYESSLSTYIHLIILSMSQSSRNLMKSDKNAAKSQSKTSLLNVIDITVGVLTSAVKKNPKMWFTVPISITYFCENILIFLKSQFKRNMYVGICLTDHFK